MFEKYPIKKIKDIPEKLREIPKPPETLYIRGKMPENESVLLAVVGSRKTTSYGREACRELIRGLKNYNITIVSGLALGIDSIAHESALENGLNTIAVPGSGLNEECLYPKSNLFLAKKILEKKGCLLSEFSNNQIATSWTFPQRNRIMAGISRATLVIEAGLKSGTLITARLALDFGRDVLAVPGSIFSSNSEGTFNLIKNGATPIQTSEDIIEALGLQKQKKLEKITYEDLSENEIKILEFISNEAKEKDEIAESLEIEVSEISSVLMTLELKGLIKESLGKVFRV